ncbi:unnamed protein product [Acanthoscelides obtectus]|uniref:Uncharacterized protein n=1 Tax=Acanthoscelides obtectus TaxID=200917 RepID=A0A9P0KS19_ACAOB|nr:unnamed protein product [Acanthoscelides obtectus]CAK1633680.1 hypothetical protein AOBTE_LOCUS8315 [Acanthoscelides obtectus]
MAFLLDRDEPTETLTSLNDDTETMEAASHEDIEDSLDQSTDINDDHSQNDRGNLDESQTVLPQVKRTCVNLKKGTKQNISREDSTIVEAFGMLKSVVAKEKPAEISDSCTDYGKHVANKLRNYSERTKAIVQYHFNNILFQADMDNFEINRNAAAMNVAANYQNSSITLPTGHFTTPIPKPSPQETSQSEVSYTDLTSPISEIHFVPVTWERLGEDGSEKSKNNAIPTMFSFTKAKHKRKPPTQRQLPACVSPLVDNEEEIVDPTPTKKKKVALPCKSSFDSSETQDYDTDISKSQISFNTLVLWAVL